jgi:hypothetical protein
VRGEREESAMPERYRWFSGHGIVDYHGAVTREFPSWKVTITGGDLPESGHILTSMSYARLEAEAMDWIEWHQIGEHHGFTDPDRYDEYEDAFTQEFGDDDPDDDDRLPDGAMDESDFNDGDVGLGEGFSFDFDFPWPEEVAQARERYQAAQDAMKEAREATEEAQAAVGEPLCAIAGVLMIGEADVGHIVGLPADEVLEFMIRHRQLEGLRQAGRTVEDWEAARRAMQRDTET